MTDFEAIESLLKTGEDENVDLACEMLKGMPEIAQQLNDKWWGWRR